MLFFEKILVKLIKNKKSNFFFNAQKSYLKSSYLVYKISEVYIHHFVSDN